MKSHTSNFHVAIACGGTGGHLFPGMAVGTKLREAGCKITLLVSEKSIDQHAFIGEGQMQVATLPAVPFQAGKPMKFAAGFVRSYLTCEQIFRRHPPQAVLGMGGFSAAPPVLAGKAFGAETFLHESNSIPGRANRFLAYLVDQVFISFPEAQGRIHDRNVLRTGTPVRALFGSLNPGASRRALGLKADAPVLLIIGGSQGARGLNHLAAEVVPSLLQNFPQWQILHLSGVPDFERVKAAYLTAKIQAVVFPFLTEIELAMSAATLAFSRAGASSLAEIAALRLPALLVPYPSAADNHQFFNAKAFVDSGAAWMLDQSAPPSVFFEKLSNLFRDETLRKSMTEGLASWDCPEAADVIAAAMMRAIFESTSQKRAGLTAVQKNSINLYGRLADTCA